MHGAKAKSDIMELFSSARVRRSYVKISAPMVRYSKLEFRTLLRSNNVDLCYTPMIVADSFCRSDLARQCEFTTNEDDTPLVVQFAAKDSIEFLTAAELVYSYADGVDLNCGCPQRWAIACGYGCAALKKPELLHDMISTVRRNLPSGFSVSVKMRLLKRDDNYAATINLGQMLEKCGASFLSIHGRTPWEKTCEPIDLEGMAQVNQSVQIPVVANGDVRTVDDADRTHQQTQCAGVMAARGLLTNPSLFTGSITTPLSCVEDWIALANSAGDKISFQCFHHHLTFMTEKLMKRKQRVVFNNLTKKLDTILFLEEHLKLNLSKARPKATMAMKSYYKCIYDGNLYSTRKQYLSAETAVSVDRTSGKFFDEHVAKDTQDDEKEQLCFMGDKSIFDESSSLEN